MTGVDVEKINGPKGGSLGSKTLAVPRGDSSGEWQEDGVSESVAAWLLPLKNPAFICGEWSTPQRTGGAREQLTGTGSLLPRGGPGSHTQVIRFCSKHLDPLSHQWPKSYFFSYQFKQEIGACSYCQGTCVSFYLLLGFS